MYRPRVIPVLLLKNKGLVKTIKFKKPTYIGDPINAVKIFNDLESDELVFLDITATKENRTILPELVKDIGDEAYMPFAVGGGIKHIDNIKKLIQAGAEKVVINSAAITNPNLIKEAAETFGNQSIIVSIDIKKNIFGKFKIAINGGNTLVDKDIITHAKEMEYGGAGEIIINSVDNDGMMMGYDINLIKSITDAVSIPVIACGGAGTLSHFADAVNFANAAAVAAGSMFVFHGSRRAVLINYPEKKELESIFI